MDEEGNFFSERDRLTDYLNIIEDGVYICNRSYILEYLNPSLEKEFGPVRNRKCYDYFHGLSKPCPCCKIEDVIAGNSVRREWYLIQTRRSYDVLEIPLKNFTGEIFKLTVLRDITGRKSNELALKKSEERYALAQKAAHLGSWDWDILTGTLEWSETIEPMFGCGPGEFRKTYEAFLNYVHAEDRQFVMDSVKASLEKGDEYDIEHRIIWPDGKIHWVSETGDIIRDKEGKPVRMLGIVQDITKKKETERNIRELNMKLTCQAAELAATNKELEAFSYSVSHDLRTPLHSIEGFSRVILEDYADRLDEQGKDYFKRILKATDRMSRLIDDILRLSHLSHTEMHCEKVDLTSLINKTLKKLGNTEPSRRVTAIVHEGLSVEGDGDLLEILVDNLVGNAWKYTSKTEQPIIECGSMKKDDELN